MEKVLCLRMFYRWKIITSKNYFPCLLFASGTSLNERGEEEYGGAKIKKVTVVDWLLGNVL